MVPRRVPVILLAGLIATACAPLLRTPNHRRLVWKDAAAVMELTRPHQGYASVWIDLRESEREWTIRTPDGRRLQTGTIDPGAIAEDRSPLLDEVGPGNRRRAFVLFDRGECAQWGYVGGSMMFEFEGERLVAIGLASDVDFPEWCRPALGPAEGDRIHPMPLDETQLVEVLGPYDHKEEYYGGL